MSKVILNMSPYLKYVLGAFLVGYCSWVVAQIDDIRNTYPEKYLSQIEYSKDNSDRAIELERIIKNQDDRMDILREDYTGLRDGVSALSKTMFEGFQETQKLILEKN